MNALRGMAAGLLAATAFAFVVRAADDADRLASIRLPEGFSIALYAGNVPNARSMTLGPKGVLFVGTRERDRVYAVIDRDGDGRGETVRTVARGLNMPNGVAWRDGALYVAEVSRILRYDGVEAWLEKPDGPAPRATVIKDDLPKDTHHGWKFIRFGPDGSLYVPIGAPCNICDRGDPYAALGRMKPDGSGFEIVARGIRNTVGFDWDRRTGDLWFTDNGRDYLGENAPPDELNRAPRPGLHFGYPYCHGRGIADPEFGRGRDCATTTAPERELGPHVAALGMRFYTGTAFPERYRNQIFIAEHGSWNRREPIGYRVMLVRVEANRAVSYETFAEGWLSGRNAWGRPVDVEVMPDGALLVSDDERGAIYRITWRGAAAAATGR